MRGRLAACPEPGRESMAIHKAQLQSVLAVLTIMAATSMSAEKPDDHPRIVAHRGYSAVAPENTLAAMTAAIEAGAHACEFDVRATADGHLVVIHDDTLDRTTTGRGKVADLTLAEVRRFDAGKWKGPKFAGQRVPTLDEALAKLKDTSCPPVIEIKVESVSRKVVDAVRKADLVERATVIAFSKNVVREVRRLEPRLRCGWLYGKELEGGPAQQAAWLAGQAAECGTDLVDLGDKMLSAGVVAELRRRKLEVWVWTVDDPARAAELVGWGVTAVTTNDPVKMRKIAATE